jgi:hypothetical protein
MIRKMLFAVALCAMFVPALTMAQPAPGGGGQGGGGRGNFDPAQARQFQLDNIKTALGASDDEWKVLSPKIEAVLTAQANMPRAGRGGQGRGAGRGGPGGGAPGGGAPGGGRGGGGFGADPNNPITLAMTELQAALDNKDTPAPTIAAKMTALRDARAKAQTALAASQKALKEVLTQRQEGTLLTMGYLE